MTFVHCADCARPVPMDPRGGRCSLCGSSSVLVIRGSAWPWLVSVSTPAQLISQRAWVRV